MKKYLIYEIEEVTNEHKDGRVIYKYPFGDRIKWNGEVWVCLDLPDDKYTHGHHYKDNVVTHHLPNGPISPDQAVEVEECRIEKINVAWGRSHDLGVVNPGPSYDPYVYLEGTKVGVFEIPTKK
jgi:hypothetical protein